MRFRSDPTKPLFTFLDVPAAEAATHPDAMRGIYEKRLDGVILRGLYPEAAMRTVLDRLMADAGALNDPAPSHPLTLGNPIVSVGADVAAYFAGAAPQAERLRRLFDGFGDFETAVARALSALSGGLAAGCAPGPGGGRCQASTVRVLTEGREIGIHADNDFAAKPQAAHLAGHVDLSAQISFFMPIEVPDEGGELFVYGLEYSDVEKLMPQDAAGYTWGEGSAAFEVLSRMPSSAFTPRPGDLLIFDGGRYFHRVSKPRGPRPRVTVGGFTGFSHDGGQLFFWS